MTNSSDERLASEMFGRVSRSRGSQLIVDRVKLLLRDGSLQPGDRLPSERDLCERFGVSRVTIREALRVLESNGLVSIKVGARGGAFVTTPTTERLGAGLADLLSLSHLTASDVTEARQVVESAALPLIVDRATDDDIADLLRLVDDGQEAFTQGEYDVAMSAAFHVRLAECAHNPALTAMIHSFQGPLLMSLREAKVSAPVMGPRGNEEHRAIVAAIQARDVAQAGRIMTAHLSRTASRVAGL